MNHFLINGIETQAPLAEDRRFEELLSYVRDKYTHEQSLISSIRIDGREIGEQDEVRLKDVELAALDSVEIQFAHPRELAEETLSILKSYLHEIADLSVAVSSAESFEALETGFIRVIDGIEVIAETISAVRASLRLPILNEIDVLQADLASILQDMVDAKREGNEIYRMALLREHLPLNLRDWADKGVPAILASRSS